MVTLRRSRPLFSLLWVGCITLLCRVWNAEWRQFKELRDIVATPHAASTQEPIHLVYASDDGSLPGVEASIRSVICHASEPVVFHYIGDTPLASLPEVKFYNLTQVAKKYKLKEFTNPRKRHDEAVQGLNTNLANYARFVIDDLLPDQSKAMWIDVDTIVRCDVVPLVRNVLSNSPYVIAAVPSSSVPRGFNDGLKKRLKMKVGFNAGVYVVDLDKWREQKMTKEMRNWTQENQEKNLYKLGSQGPMILTFHDNFEPLSYKWNTKVSHVDAADKRGNAEDACILHWSGPNKPWEKDGVNKELWVPCTDETSTS